MGLLSKDFASSTNRRSPTHEHVHIHDLRVCVFYHVLPYIVCVAHERVHLVHIHELHKVHVSINIASFFTMHRAPQRSCC